MSHVESGHSAVEVFLKSWQVYQDIIAHNYMFHYEISNAVRDVLVGFKPGQKLSILDLGCGDGSMTLPLLPPERISLYAGCDLSQPALDIAQKQVDALNIPAQLLCEDMLKVVTAYADQSVDLIFSSYAVHHLNTQNKKQLVEQVIRVLKPGGQFVIIDIFLEPSEDRDAYMQHYMERLSKTWINLSSEAKNLVTKHAIEYDFPEKPAFYQTLCKQLGLDSGNRLAKHTWHEAWVFKL